MQYTSFRTLQRVPKARRGGALIASLIMATLLAGLGAGLVQVQTAITRRQMSAIDQTRAMYMAEAGLAEAFIALAQGKSGAIANANQPAKLGGGLFWVEATEGADGQVLLRCTGIIERAHATLESVVERSVSPFGRLGFFGLEEVVLRKGARVLADKDQPALVRSNGDVSLAPSIGGNLIEGRIIAGTNGLIAMGPGSSVSTGMEQARRAAVLPEILVPNLPQGNLQQALEPKHANIGPGGLDAEELEVDGGQEVRLIGPLVLALDTLEVEDGGSLLIDASAGPVIIHVRHELTMEEGSVWQHEAGSISDVSLFFHGTDPVDWKVKGVFRGAIVAIEQDWALTGELDFQGSIAVKSLELLADVQVRGSEEATNLIAGVPSVPTLVAWQFSDAPDAEILNCLTDPKNWLKQHQIEPVKSSSAAAESEVSLQYVTKDGAIGVYQGLPSEFDFSKASSVVQQVWMDGLIGEGQLGPPPAPLPSYASPVGNGSSSKDQEKNEGHGSHKKDGDDHKDHGAHPKHKHKQTGSKKQHGHDGDQKDSKKKHGHKDHKVNKHSNDD